MLNKPKFYFKIFFTLVVAGGFLFFSGNFEKNAMAEGGEKDALAIRVLPNPNHYSPMTWYKKQGFKGEPKPLKVDGYEAVQDGRTVFVNVANVSGSCILSGRMCNSDADCTSSHDPCLFLASSLYTNIYLISYNQEAEANTVGIFNKILSGWRFNSNLVASGNCSKTTTINCLTDNDCSSGEFCSSLKARITRDIKRLADMADMRESIESYEKAYGYYPKLSSGTYLSGRTISTWPSWQTTFSAEVGIDTPTDPINKLGDCGGPQYDPVTCWDDQNKSFSGSIPDRLPAGSSVMVYATDEKGENYDLCAVMESGLLVNGISSDACAGSFSENKPPKITCGSLSGIVGEEFAGFIDVSDPNGDALTITVDNLPQGFTLNNTNNPNQKKVSAVSAPLSANGTIINVTAIDGPNSVSENCEIKVSGDAFIVYPLQNQKVVINKSVNFVIYANHSKKNYDGIAFIFNGAPSGFACNRSSKISNDGRYECVINYSTIQLGTNQISVYARNAQGEISTTQTFSLEVYNNSPVINALNCKDVIRMDGSAYECKFTFSDPDGHDITGTGALSGIPSGLNVVLTSRNEGRIFGVPTVVGVFDISITVDDQFGARSAPAKYTLKINNYCGDEVKQTPNTEGRGGIKNDGFEDCDGEDGIPNIGQSSSFWQYGCSSDCYSLKNGWCGDGIIQDGEYSTYPPLGIQTIPGFDLKHAKNDYGEQCDFGDNINCCNGCRWIDNNYIDLVTTPATGIIAANNRLPIVIPSSRGVRSIVFDSYPNIATDDFSSLPGISIMLISDITNLPTAQTLDNIKIAAKTAVDNFHTWATDNNVNVMMGAFGFGEGTTGITCPELDYFCWRQDPINLKSSFANAVSIKNKIDSYQQVGDLPGARSGIDLAIPEAHNLLIAQPSNYRKYLIILSDGCSCTYNNQTLAAATAAKNDGIEVYTACYWDNNLGRNLLCGSSSQNGSNCGDNGPYAYNSDQAGMQMESIVENIITNIIATIPVEYFIRIENADGDYVQSSALTSTLDQTGVRINISSNVLSCDISGSDCVNPTLYINPYYSGSGNVQINNIRANILPACNQ